MGSSSSKYEGPRPYPMVAPPYRQGFVPPLQPTFQTGTRSKSKKRKERPWGTQNGFGYAYPNGLLVPNGYQMYRGSASSQSSPLPLSESGNAMVEPPPGQPYPMATAPAGVNNAQPAQQAPFVPPAPVEQEPTAPPAPLFSPNGEAPLTGLPSPQAGPSTGRSTGRRTQTPFPASSGMRFAEPQPEPQQQPQQQQQRQRRRASAHHDSDIARALEPLTPANPSVFGPPGPRPRTPIRNPLPIPPRDLYETSPYNTLLNLPQTTALLTATYGQPQRSKTGAFGGKKPRKGLFHSLSLRRHDKEPEVHFVPVFVQANGNNAASGSSSMPVPPPGTAPLPQFMPASAAVPAPTASVPPPLVSQLPPPVRFNQQTPLSGFMNHSTHRVLYQNKTYPSATHLHEAMKYLENRPDIAERIRSTDINEVYPLSASFQKYQRPDWTQVFLSAMEEVLYLKFKQHPDLRSLLMGTGVAPIIYADAIDHFWGEGDAGRGANELGKALVRVRDRLRAEGYR